MKLREKIAMIWTFPIIMVITISLAIIAFVLVAISKILNLTGTFGAGIYLFQQMKLKIIDRRLRKLVKEDEKLHNFDS
jgi:preprotein translocase subunit SecG